MINESRWPPTDPPAIDATTSTDHGTHRTGRPLDAEEPQAMVTPDGTSDRYAGHAPKTDPEHLLTYVPSGPTRGDARAGPPDDRQAETPEPHAQPATLRTEQSAQAPEQPPSPDDATIADPPESSDLAERRGRIVDELADRHGLDTETDRETLAKAFDAARSHLAPVIVHATAKIIDDCKPMIAERPDTVIVFLGRDAHTMALASHELDPELFANHCAEAPISRCLADSLVQDLETGADKTFPEIASFRDAREDVKPENVPGSRAEMTRFLESRGIPVGKPGANIILIDTSFKGSVQSLLSVTYPEVNFHGKYLIFGETQRDPHAEHKQGYLLHQAADGTVNSRTAMPADLAATLSDKDTVLAIEQSLRGSYSKAERFGPDHIPEQHPEAPSLNQINPLEISPAYLGESVRMAVMDINQRAVPDYAREVVERRRAGENTDAGLAAAAEAGLRRVQSWATRSSTDNDRNFTEMLDSVVRRSDKHIVSALRVAIEARQLAPAETNDLWRRYQRLDSLEDKHAFLDRFEHTTPNRGTEHG